VPGFDEYGQYPLKERHPLRIPPVRYGVLQPFSRAQAGEADLMGLDLMAKAGAESVKLWAREAKRKCRANEGSAYQRGGF